MPDIFDEVSQDLRAERAQRLLRRYGGVLVIAAVLVVVAVGGWKYSEYRDGQARAAVATAYLDAVGKADAPGPAQGPGKVAAAAQFATMAQSAPAGYRVLATLRDAALKAQAGDLPGASALWDQVSADESVDPELRQLADLLWAQHQLAGGAPDIVAGRLAPLAVPGRPYRALAMELQALLKLRTGDRPAAVTILKQLAAVPDAPPGVRTRAGALLAELGETPAAGGAG